MITSSPASTPTARSARCNPAVPLLTAQACAAPTRAANTRSNFTQPAARATAAPSAAPPAQPASSASPKHGLRQEESGRQRRRHQSRLPVLGGSRSERPDRARSRLRARHYTVPGRAERSTTDEGLPPCIPNSSESTRRVPRGGDQVLGNPNRAPYILPIRGIDQHPGNGPGPLRLIEYPNLEVDQIDVLQMRMDLPDRVAQRPVQGMHRPVALGGAHIPLAARPRS